MRVLILGGTTEARELAGLLAGEHQVITSLAGRTSAPRRPAGEVRVGGFGGADGLAGYLAERRIEVLVDATHPFAATMTGHAVAAGAAAGVPVMILRRPGWTASPGDVWHRVASLAEAAAVLPGLGRRVFLTTGRQGIGAFAGLDECWFLARSVEPPAPPVPRRLEVLLDRGPFTVAGERELLTRHRIDVLVSKDSGGSDAKLVAARELGVPVLLVDRPPVPAAATVTGAEAAAEWIRQRSAR
ncbi:precorrin-6A/cobalt-precorrin-6A reductase [Actinoplanes octamycinicus]|uniref:Precorrin-6A/cobalt-precorrin-6A reductase n=1 Tax=Actinoplanes octamycinicus TaxID=135948 RepID=A0A7W7GR00_9ACTN|nr:cobalt-precorrin-6A reductase [Actinoplanes octamycinicus]MBB4736715.1 precorrin-6A/cobalt-precorrin-6A reductase [Actinoplanes octamycinicus]GIE60482.1 precorrin-6A reductase [Actinoplanes octamycinicus]